MPSFLPRISIGIRRALDPAAAMAGGVLFRDAAQQQDRLGQYQLSHRAGVRVGRVEHGDTAFAGGVEVDLVGADAEAADRDQFLRAVEDLFGQLGAGANADEVRIGDGPAQFVLGQRLGVGDDVAVPGGAEGLHRVLADAFEQQDADVLLRVGGFLRGHGDAYGERGALHYARCRRRFAALRHSIRDQGHARIVAAETKSPCGLDDAGGGWQAWRPRASR